MLRAFRIRFPEVKLELREITSNEQIEGLHTGTIDLGFSRSPLADAVIEYETLLQEPFVVALPEAHPLAQHPTIALRSLASQPFILFPRVVGAVLYDQILSLCSQAGFSPTVAQEARSMHTIVSLVASGLGIAIVPASLQHLQRTGVVYRPFEGATLSASIAVVWRQHETAPTVERFLEVVREVKKSLLDSPVN